MLTIFKKYRITTPLIFYLYNFIFTMEISETSYCGIEFEIKKNGSEYGNRSVWRLHHDHITGEFRGYFCDDCNVSMGRAQDNPEILRRLANSLERNNGFKTVY